MSGDVTVTLPGGEKLPVPPALNDALDRALRACRAFAEAGDYADWRTAFGLALTAALFEDGLLLVPRAFAKSSEAVNVNVYSLAREAQHRAERRLQEATAAFRGNGDRGDLHAEFDAALRALTGHAPLEGVSRVGDIDARLRTLRLALLFVPIDEPAAELQSPFVAEPAPSGNAA